MQQNPVFPPEIMAILGVVIAIACGILVIVYVIYIFYCLTLYRALSRVAPENRSMEPALAWLYLVPCVQLVWQFFIVTRVPDSLKREFQFRRRDDGSDYGKTIGVTQAVLNVVNIPLSWVGSIVNQQGAPEISLIFSGLSLVLSLVAFILFIIFWVKIAGYSGMLAAQGDRPFRDPRLDDYDDDDDRGGPRPGGAPSAPSDAYKEGDPGQFK